MSIFVNKKLITIDDIDLWALAKAYDEHETIIKALLEKAKTQPKEAARELLWLNDFVNAERFGTFGDDSIAKPLKKELESARNKSRSDFYAKKKRVGLEMVSSSNAVSISQAFSDHQELKGQCRRNKEKLADIQKSAEAQKPSVETNAPVKVFTQAEIQELTKQYKQEKKK